MRVLSRVVSAGEVSAAVARRHVTFGGPLRRNSFLVGPRAESDVCETANRNRLRALAPVAPHAQATRMNEAAGYFNNYYKEHEAYLITGNLEQSLIDICRCRTWNKEVWELRK